MLFRSGTGYGASDLDALIDDIAGIELDTNEDNNYSRSIEAPVYEITGDCPEVKDLAKLDKYTELRLSIEKSEAPKEIKDFLLHAASRHIVFDYRNIAEYYAHADKDIQDLFEQSALVIIDFDKALQYGFIDMVKELQEIVGQDAE